MYFIGGYTPQSLCDSSSNYIQRSTILVYYSFDFTKDAPVIPIRSEESPLLSGQNSSVSLLRCFITLKLMKQEVELQVLQQYLHHRQGGRMHLDVGLL